MHHCACCVNAGLGPIVCCWVSCMCDLHCDGFASCCRVQAAQAAADAGGCRPPAFLHCTFEWRCWHMCSVVWKALQLPLLVMLQHIWGALAEQQASWHW